MFLICSLPSKSAALLLCSCTLTFLPFQNKAHKDKCAYVTIQILIQKYKLLALEPMQMTCRALDSAVK